jgi:RNA polymerase-binding transcription factor
MTPASKGAQVKRASASRSPARGSSRAGNKTSSSKVERTITKSSKKKAAPVVKKAVTTAKKPASPVKKSTVVASKRAAAATAKKSTTTKKAGPAPKKSAPAVKKAPQAKKAGTSAVPAKKAAAKPAAKKSGSTAAGSRASAANGAGAPGRTAFSPKPKPPPPVRPKTGPYAKDSKFLDEVRELLEADRAIYQEQATSLRAEADSLALEREPGDVQFDEESGEGGTVTVDRERNLALSGQATLAVEEIDDALRRIEDKTYGYCERCFQPIPKPRLRALPYARLCVACKSGGLSRR